MNKEEKKPYKKAIVSYLEWVWTMAPLLAGDLSYKTVTNNRGYCGNYLSDCNLFREALMDESIEERTHLAAVFIAHYASLGGYNRYFSNPSMPPPNVTEDSKKFRTTFNSWVNDRAGFNETFNEYKG